MLTDGLNSTIKTSFAYFLDCLFLIQEVQIKIREQINDLNNIYISIEYNAKSYHSDVKVHANSTEASPTDITYKYKIISLVRKIIIDKSQLRL